jgi:hypothetical protein
MRLAAMLLVYISLFVVLTSATMIASGVHARGFTELDKGLWVTRVFAEG